MGTPGAVAVGSDATENSVECLLPLKIGKGFSAKSSMLLGGLHSTEVAYLLLTQQPRV